MKHNQVILCGIIQENPRFGNLSESKMFAQFRVITINGNRSGGRQIEARAYDAPLIYSTDPAMIKQIAKITVGDLVIIKGAITTATVTRSPKCQHCGERASIPSLLTYVSPAGVNVIDKGAALTPQGMFNKDLAIQRMAELKEISNLVTIVGVVCREPQPYKSDGKQKRRITSYQLAVKRKLRIIGEVDDNTCDFPWIKSYGKIGINDGLYIKKGTYMFIDGWLRARKFERTNICPHCGKEMKWIDVSQTIVPYASEYIKNYNEPDTITHDDELIYNSKRIHIENEDSVDEYTTISDEEKNVAEEELDKIGISHLKSDIEIENDIENKIESDDTIFDLAELKKKLP